MGKGDPPKSRMSQLSTLLVMVTGGYRGISFGPIVHYPESLPTEMPPLLCWTLGEKGHSGSDLRPHLGPDITPKMLQRP